MKFLVNYTRHRRLLIFTTGLLVADGLFFTLTNPATVPSVVLIVGFLLVAFSLNGLLKVLVLTAALYGLPVGRHAQRSVLFISVALSISLALQSIGELTARDLVVLILLSLLSYVYVSYGRIDRQV